MANNYLQFSVGVTVSPKGVAWAEEYYGSEQHIQDAAEEGIESDYWEEGFCDGFSMELYPEDKKGQVLVFAEEFGDVAAAADFIRRLLEADESDDFVTLEWAETCSKPRPDEFGGGYLLIHRNGVEYPPSEFQWIERRKKEIASGVDHFRQVMDVPESIGTVPEEIAEQVEQIVQAVRSGNE